MVFNRASENFQAAVNNFSFSGLKTAVLRKTQQYGTSQLPINDLAASFQAAVVDALVTKTVQAAEDHHVTAVHLVGGVSANRALRSAMRARLEKPEMPEPVWANTQGLWVGQSKEV